MTERTLERNKDRIWKAIERGIEGDLPELKNGANGGSNPDEGYEARVDFALAYLKGICLNSEIDPALVGNRAEVTALVLDAANPEIEAHRLLSGWRADFCGKALLDLLQGRGSLRIDCETNLPVQG